jgi:hypothetical protein
VTTSFTRTRNQIAQRVLGKVIRQFTTAATIDADIVYEAIDLRLKEMHKLGIFWRKVTSVPVTFSLSSSVGTASAGAGDILFPLKMTFTNGDADDPIQIIGPKEYAAIEDKSRIGSPEKALWKGGTEFQFYPVPGSNGTAKLLYEKIADDTTSGAAVDVDVSMIRPLMDIVKYDVADDFGVDEQTQMRWRAESIQAEKDIRKLGALRIDYEPVRVDDYDGPARGRETDYAR